MFVLACFRGSRSSHERQELINEHITGQYPNMVAVVDASMYSTESIMRVECWKELIRRERLDEEALRRAASTSWVPPLRSSSCPDIGCAEAGTSLASQQVQLVHNSSMIQSLHCSSSGNRRRQPKQQLGSSSAADPRKEPQGRLCATELWLKTPGCDMTCGICTSDFAEGELLQELPCHHTFHASCINAWLPKSMTCPMCRQACIVHEPNS